MKNNIIHQIFIIGFLVCCNSFPFVCYAANKIDEKELQMQKEVEEAFKKYNLQDDIKVLEKAVFNGKFDKFDLSIRKELLISQQLFLEANAYYRKKDLSNKISDEMNEDGFKLIIIHSKDYGEFDKLIQAEIKKIQELKSNSLKDDEREVILKQKLREAALNKRFDKFDITIRKLFEFGNKESAQAKEYEKKANSLFFEATKYRKSWFVKMMSAPVEKVNADAVQEK